MTHLLDAPQGYLVTVSDEGFPTACCPLGYIPHPAPNLGLRTKHVGAQQPPKAVTLTMDISPHPQVPTATVKEVPGPLGETNLIYDQK